MKGLPLSRSWGRKLSDMKVLKSKSCARRRSTGGPASLRASMHGTRSGANGNADVEHVASHLTPLAAQPSAWSSRAAFLQTKKVTLQSSRDLHRNSIR